MQVHLSTPLLFTAALTAGVGLFVGHHYGGPADPLSQRVVETLLLQTTHSEVDGRRLRWLVQTGDAQVARWAQQELALLEAAVEAPSVDPLGLSDGLFVAVRSSVPAPAAAEPLVPDVPVPEGVSAVPVPVSRPGIEPAPPVVAAGAPKARTRPAVVVALAEATWTSPWGALAPTEASDAPETRPEAAESAASAPMPEAIEADAAPESVGTSEPEREAAEEPEPEAKPPPAPTGLVRSGGLTLYGELDPAQVQQAIAARIPRWRVCYDDALVNVSSAAGTLELAFSVTSGHITGLEIGLDQIGDQDLARCVSRVAGMLQVDGEGEVVLPLVFELADAGDGSAEP